MGKHKKYSRKEREEVNFKVSVEIDGEDMGFGEVNADLKGIQGYTLDYASKNICRHVSDRLSGVMYGIVRKALEKRGIR